MSQAGPGYDKILVPSRLDEDVEDCLKNLTSGLCCHGFIAIFKNPQIGLSAG